MTDTATDAHLVMFSRPTTSGFGKCTAVLKTLVPDELKDDFARRARELVKSKAKPEAVAA